MRSGAEDSGRPSGADSRSSGRLPQATVEAAAQDCPAARELLELLAFLASETIPRDLLGADPEALLEGLRGPFDRDGAIEALARFSLIRAGAASVTVHRLVQAVTRNVLDAATSAARAGTAVRLVRAAWPGTDWGRRDRRPVIATLSPHSLAATEVGRAPAEAAGAVLNEAATYLHARGAFGEAGPLFERALAIGERTLGPEHQVFATRLNNLAELYRVTGRLAEAGPLHERAITIQ